MNQGFKGFKRNNGKNGKERKNRKKSFYPSDNFHDFRFSEKFPIFPL